MKPRPLSAREWERLPETVKLALVNRTLKATRTAAERAFDRAQAAAAQRARTAAIIRAVNAAAERERLLAIETWGDTDEECALRRAVLDH